jgi:hypothetical protein
MVEQPIRNRSMERSNPPAGSNLHKTGAIFPGCWPGELGDALPTVDLSSKHVIDFV